MKKIIKRTSALVLAVATTAGVVGTTGATFTSTVNVKTNNSATVSASTTDAMHNTLQISKYDKTVKLYSDFTLPTANFVGDSSSTPISLTEFTVTTPSGDTFTQEDARISDNKFKVDEIGTYRIAYKYGSYNGEVTFESETSTYSISLIENSENILPSKIAIKNKDGSKFTGELKVPDCKVTDADGESFDADIEIKVSKPDLSTPIDISTSKKIVFDDANEIKEGYYIITYTAYKTGTGEFLCQTKTEFKAVSSDVYENEYDLTLTYGSSVPESVNVGKTIELPIITAKNGSDVVPIYYTVKVYENGSTTPIEPTKKVGTTDTLVITKNEKGVYEFTADKVGVYYRVVYEAKDALGNTATTEFNISNVEDSLKPTPIVVDAYTYDSTKPEEEMKRLTSELKNKDYALKSIFGQNDNGVYIKAIFAEDLGTFNYEDYHFERIIQNSSREEIYKDSDDANARKELVFNYTGTEPLDEDKYIKVDSVTLTDDYYYVYYKVTDANKQSNSISYKFTVNKNFDGKNEEGQDYKPTVEFNDNFYSSINLGEKVEFSEITATDDKDERLETKVYFKYTVGGVLGEEEVLTLNDSGKYVVDTSKAPAGATKVTIYAEATNDSGKTTTISEEIDLESEIIGTSVPTVYDIEDGYQTTYNQGEEIIIPTIKFIDGGDGVESLNATISVKCTTADSVVVDYTNYVQDAIAIKLGLGSERYFVYSNAHFIASQAGNYQVAINVSDAAGNVIVKFINYTVNSSTPIGELKFKDISFETKNDFELGDTLKLQKATIVGPNADEYTYEVKCVENVGNYKLSNSEFKPLATGKYVLKYVMYKSTDLSTMIESDEEIVVNVVDTKGPTISIKNGWTTTLENGETVNKTIESAYPVNTKILIPMFTASDISGINEEESNIVIEAKNSSGSSISRRVVKYSDMLKYYKAGQNKETENSLYYEFVNNAEYTITYTAKDKAGNTTTQAYTIKVGDMVAPTLVVDEDILDATFKPGQIIEINLDDIDVSDEGTTLDKSNIKVVLKNKDTGKTVSKSDDLSTETIYKYKLEDAGQYEMTFEVEDNAKNKTTITREFSVQSEEKSKMTSTEVIGTVLIVVSVVVLAGVVVYFIISKRKMDKLYKG